MKFAFALALSCVAVPYATLATAADEYTQAEREACEPEVNRLCADFITDRDKIIQCLTDKVKQLNPACKKVIVSKAKKKK